MMIVLLCQEMKWTYQEYLCQPAWFLRALRQKLEIDNKNANIKNRPNKINS